MSLDQRLNPNIIITGTPGVGKSNHCALLAEKTGLRHLSISQVVTERHCHEGWDEQSKSYVVDDDKVGCLRVLEYLSSNTDESLQAA